MSEHFVGFPPSGGTHGGKGPFRTSYQTLTRAHWATDADKTCFSSPKITSKFVLAKFHCTHPLPPGDTFTYEGGGTRRKFRKRPLYNYKRQQLMSTPKKHQFKSKKLKNPKNKNFFLSMCFRSSSQIIKTVLVVLISGILLSEKHPKTYQLGLWQSTKV